MNDPLDQEQSQFSPAQLVSIVRRRRWWVISCTFLVWLLASAIGWIVPPKYKSETTILIEQQKVPEHYVVPNVSEELQQRLQSLTEQILSRTRLLGIVNKYELYNGSGRTDPDSLVDRMRTDVAIELVRGARGDDLSAFKISYSAGTPQLAQQVTGELTSLFIEENLRNREQLSEQTTAFLDNELSLAKKSLDDQEAKVREFKSKYLGQLPEQLNSNLTILGSIQSRLQAANEALAQAEQQRLFLQSRAEQYRSLIIPTAQSDGNITPASIPVLNQQLTQLRNQLAEYSARYTPEHPDVVRLKDQIENAEKMKTQAEAELAASKKAAEGKTAPSDTKPVRPDSPLTQIEAQLAQNDFEISRLRPAIASLNQQIEDYQHRLNLTPVREQEFAAITRDHEESQKNYESLLAKKLQSELATNLEHRQQGETFEVLDPPNLPQKPYRPNRLAFGLGGTAGGFVLGLALSFLLEFLLPRIHCEAQIKTFTAVPVLVTIPPMKSESEGRSLRFRLILEGIGASCLLMTMAAGNLFLFVKS